MICGEVGSFRFGETVFRSQETVFRRLFLFVFPSPFSLTTRAKWFPCWGVAYLPLNKERIA
jgi:hypothetical protein